MISLMAVEELAMETWPNFNHAAINLPDERKGEKIILVTDNQEANRRQIQEAAKRLHYGELYIPRKVVLAEEMPLLSTGKIDYVHLAELVKREDEEGTGWISRLTHLMKKSDTETETDNEISSADPSTAAADEP